MYLSAPEAILPAIRRTRVFLFRPFRLGTYLKLCLVALLTEGLGGNSHFSHVSGHHPAHHGAFIGPPLHFGPELLAAAIFAGVVAAVVSLVIFYLITRLRFAYFHCLVHNIREIGPGWMRYGSQAARFFWLNIVVALCFLLLIAIAAVPFTGSFIRLVRASQAGVHPSIGSILSLVLPLIPIVVGFLLAAFAADIILRDFMLPHFALEDATAGQAWAAVWERIGAEKSSFFVYALLRIVLPIIGMIVLFAILVIPGAIYLAVVAMVEVGIHATLGGAAIARILLMAVVGLISALIALVVGICFGGPLSTAVREYAIVFYGGRYRRLGEILFPPPAPLPPAAPGTV